jgi:hypothetical protein
MKHHESGSVLPFTAVFLMVLFIIGGIILDGGNFYIRHGELHHLSKQSTHAGMLAFIDILEIKAMENKAFLCNSEEPPSICKSTNLFDFLSQGEIVNLVSSPTVQTLVIKNSSQFAIDYDPLQKITYKDVFIVFPYEYEGPSKIQIKVHIKDTPDQFFEGVLSLIDEVSVSAVGYISTPFYF